MWMEKQLPENGRLKRTTVCVEVVCESLPEADKLQRLTTLLNLQELINSGHQTSAKSVQGHWYTIALTDCITWTMS